MTSDERRTVHRGCNLCEASCGLTIEVQGSAVLSIRGDADDPISRGYVCPKGIALQDLQTDPDRLRRPVRRTAEGTFEPIGWDEALDLVADRLTAHPRPRRRPRDLALPREPHHPWLGAGHPDPAAHRRAGREGRYSAASVDQQPQHLLSYLLFGSPLLLPVPDIDRTDLLLVIGGNPVVSNGSIMTAPDMRRRSRTCAAGVAGWWSSTRGAARRPTSPTSTCRSGPAPTSGCWPRCSPPSPRRASCGPGARRAGSTGCSRFWTPCAP